VVIGPDEALGWGYAAGIVAEFCALGGDVVKRVWVSPLVDPSAVVEAVPKQGIDGIFFLTPSGPQLLALLKGLPLLKDGLAGKVVGQATVFVDFSQSLGKEFDGAVYSAAGTSSYPDTPMAEYIARHAKVFPKLFRYAGLAAPAAGFGLAYYNGIEAVLRALEQTGGDLSGGQQQFRAALAQVEMDAPNGHIRLDSRRQVIAPNYLNRLTLDATGKMTVHTFLTVPDVDQTFGGLFSESTPPPGRTSPPCKRGRPAPWARG
jgi:branched-chain amino acid transport system substrate-binding protein